MSPILLIAASILPRDTVARDRCELVDRNTFYNEHGEVVFVQMIFWDADGHCRAWRMDKGQFTVTRDYANHEWIVRWNDDGTHRVVRCRTFESTHSQYDPELADRDAVPVCQRRALRQIP